MNFHRKRDLSRKQPLTTATTFDLASQLPQGDNPQSSSQLNYQHAIETIALLQQDLQELGLPEWEKESS